MHTPADALTKFLKNFLIYYEMGQEILLYVPNIIGYVRLLLVTICIFFFDRWPLLFITIYSVSAVLDALDGFCARKLNQTSVFGAWFDVVVDLFSRGLLWCLLYQWGYLVIMVEWLTFVCTHKRGSNWQIPDEDFPSIVKLVMSKGFKTPLGAVAMTGVHVLPIWLYGCEKDLFSNYIGMLPWLQNIGTIILVLGRLLALRVEVFFIVCHIKGLLTEDNKE